jgi:hypothetical protein
MCEHLQEIIRTGNVFVKNIDNQFFLFAGIADAHGKKRKKRKTELRKKANLKVETLTRKMFRSTRD